MYVEAAARGLSPYQCRMQIDVTSVAGVWCPSSAWYVSFTQTRDNIADLANTSFVLPIDNCTVCRQFAVTSTMSLNYIFSRRFNCLHLCYQLPSSFHQPHAVHCAPGSSHPAHITLSVITVITFVLTTITPSAFHSRLKTHLCHKSFPPVFLVPIGLTSRSRILNLTGRWRRLF